MAKLSEAQKLFVIQRLACFETPAEVREALKQEHGVEVSLPAITYYDPNTAEGARLAKPLKDLFESTRRAFVENVQAIPIANQAYRLRELHKLYQRNQKNPVLCASLLEQAAKEAGGAYTNRREMTGKDGGPIAVQQRPADLSQLSEEELEQLDRLRAKLDGDPPAA